MAKKSKKTKKKDKFEGTYELIHISENPEIDKLVRLYKEDRFKARVVYMNGDKDLYQITRLGLFTNPNGDFNLVLFKKTFGINKNNVMYSNERRVVNLVYKGGKFHKVVYIGSNRYVQQVTLNNLTNYIPWDMCDIVKNFFIKKFTWLRHMDEVNILTDMSFNSIVNKKLFSLKKAMSYQYKVPYPVAKIFHNIRVNSDITKYIQTYLPYIKNIENFNKEWAENGLFLIFYDTIKMGRILNRQVNCSWSVKRLKAEHDKWAKEIADIVYTHDNRDMNVGQIYRDFETHSKFKLLTTTKEMSFEGRKQNHCVASYVSMVDNHGCGIYIVGDYTLELRKKNINGYELLTISQLRGRNNEDAPIEWYEKVEELVNSFNKRVAKGDYDECATKLSTTYSNQYGELLPF